MKIPTAVIIGIALAGAASAASATTISTLGFWDGSTSVSAWGGISTNTYGEVFTAPGGSLTSFTFEVNTDGAPASFVGEVYAWSGSVTGGNGPQGPSGPALYTSAPMTSPGDNAFDALTINTGAVALTAGQNYVIDLYDDSADGVGAQWGLAGFFSHPGVAGDDGFNFNNGPSDSAIWDDSGDFGSLAYSASFSGVPEVSSWTLLLVGFGGLGVAKRSRRRAALTA